MYICGYGRSGSTVLDIAIGSGQGVASVGELSNFADSWLENRYCACEKKLRECHFWRNVSDQVSGMSDEQIRHYEERRRVIERKRLIPIVGRANIALDQEGYCIKTSGLIEAISREAGVPVVIDSSKSPFRALALSRIRELDFYLIHLVRDPRAVAWSLAKSLERDVKMGVQNELKKRAALRSAMAWVHTNYMCEKVSSLLPFDKKLFVRYEDFVKNPHQLFKKLGKMLDTDFDNVANLLSSGMPLPKGHTVAGNRMRMNSSIRLIPDFEWQERMPSVDRRKVKLVCGRMIRSYGYSG